MATASMPYSPPPATTSASSCTVARPVAGALDSAPGPNNRPKAGRALLLHERLYLFVAIDRTSKFAFVELHDKADRPTAVRFLEALIAAVPYRLHTVLTDNGIQFADLPKNRDGWTARYRVHRFDQICRASGIEHRLSKPNRPSTNGQVERMNRTLKEATVNRYHYDNHEQLRAHLADFVTAYNFARRLKILKGLSPHEYICNAWSKEPARFILDPIQQMPGLNN